METPIRDELTVYDYEENKTHALRDLWRGCAGFLCGGGPSIKELPYHRLAERGICSLGINNIAGMVPCRAFTLSDPPEKAHHGIWRDPAILKLIPRPKFTRRGRGTTREKLPDGSFKYLEKRTIDYPSTFGYERRGWHLADRFFDGRTITKVDGKLQETDLHAATVGNNGKEGVPFTGRPKIIFTLFLGLRLLHYLGVRRVYLLGVDFFMDPGKAEERIGNYAFDEQRDRGAIDGNNAIYHVANDMLCEMVPYFEKQQFFVFNVNPVSRLRAFPHIPWDEAFADCKNGVPDEPLSLDGWYIKGEHK